MPQKRAEEIPSFSEFADCRLRVNEELRLGLRSQVPKFVVFQVSPRVLDRVQLRRIGRKLEEVNPAVPAFPA